MLAIARSVAFLGAEARLVDLELAIHDHGLPGFSIGGLAARSVREAEQRTRAACEAVKCPWPSRRIVANLAPARLPKEGTHFDLALALAVMSAEGAVPAGALDGWVAVGELGLDGTLRGVPGVLPAAIATARAGHAGLICPAANAAEAAIVDGIEVAGVEDLATLQEFLRGHVDLPPPQPVGRREGQPPDLSEVRGHGHAKRALEIAAAGGHNILLDGPPGSGKTMLARRLPGIQPALTREEALEITQIHSIAGLLGDNATLVTERPFRAPHHNISLSGLIGGGTGLARPGEVVLAHRGCLFLDELPLFPRHLLEALRAPVEDGVVRIARSLGIVSYPSRFALVGAMNPCPCGFYGDPRRVCECSTRERIAYQHRLSGPLLDRFDLCVTMARPTRQELLYGEPGEASATVRGRVEGARERQLARTGRTNADGDGRGRFRAGARLSGAAVKLLAEALDTGMLSARGLDRVIRVARTIADLEGSTSTSEDAIAEALALRRGTIRESAA